MPLPTIVAGSSFGLTCIRRSTTSPPAVAVRAASSSSESALTSAAAGPRYTDQQNRQLITQTPDKSEFREQKPEFELDS